MIVRFHALGPALAEALAQVADRSGPEGELGGEAGDALAPEQALQELAPDGDGYGFGHGDLLAQSDVVRGMSIHQMITIPSRQNLARQRIRQNLLVRDVLRASSRLAPGGTQ
jgi:hypothetical protein